MSLKVFAASGIAALSLVPGLAVAQEPFAQQIDCYLLRLIEKNDEGLEKARILTEKDVQIVGVRGRTISYRKRGYKQTMFIVAASDMHCHIKVPGS